MVDSFFGTGWLTLGEPACLTAETNVDSHIHTCMIPKVSHGLWSGLWMGTDAPLSNFRATVFQFGQGEEVWPFSRRLFTCLLQSLIFFTALISEGKRQRRRVGATCTALPRPLVLLVRALLEAAGAVRIPVRVQLRGHGVGDHASQDVVLRGHHVLDEEIGSVVDVEVVLKARRRTWGGCPFEPFENMVGVWLHRQQPPPPLPRNLSPSECRVWMQHEAAHVCSIHTGVSAEGVWAFTGEDFKNASQRIHGVEEQAA